MSKLPEKYPEDKTPDPLRRMEVSALRMAAWASLITALATLLTALAALL